jgi:hypothetical protein
MGTMNSETTVQRTQRGWTGTTSTGREAYITDGNSHWFARDFGLHGRLTDSEQRELDNAAMHTIANGESC